MALSAAIITACSEPSVSVWRSQSLSGALSSSHPIVHPCCAARLFRSPATARRPRQRVSRRLGTRRQRRTSAKAANASRSRRRRRRRSFRRSSLLQLVRRQSSRPRTATNHPPCSWRVSTAWASASRGRRGRPTLRNPSDNSARRRSESHRADRQLTNRDLHEEGQEVRHDWPRALRSGAHRQRLPGIRRAVRGDETTATPSCATTSSPIAGWSSCRSSAAVPFGPISPTVRTASEPALHQPAGEAGPARTRGATLSTATATAGAARGARTARPRAGRRTRAGAARSLRDVLRDQHERRSAGLVLSLRVPASAVSRLSAARHLARRLLRPYQHWRRGHPEARLRRRSREDAQR